ncbi:MAG: hypothetical protein U1F61_17295 [Opitutaceae bacterium]
MSPVPSNKPVTRTTDPAEAKADGVFTSWCALAGGCIGLVVAAFVGHLWGWVLGIGVIGAVAGALVDRHRRP